MAEATNVCQKLRAVMRGKENDEARMTNAELMPKRE
jgi:hypothetical protein